MSTTEISLAIQNIRAVLDIRSSLQHDYKRQLQSTCAMFENYKSINHTICLLLRSMSPENELSLNNGTVENEKQCDNKLG